MSYFYAGCLTTIQAAFDAASGGFGPDRPRRSELQFLALILRRTHEQLRVPASPELDQLHARIGELLSQYGVAAGQGDDAGYAASVESLKACARELHRRSRELPDGSVAGLFLDEEV